MIIDFNKVQKIKLDSYTIDDAININALKAFDKILIKSKYANLDFVVTGGLGSLLFYNKLYRDLKDIDILIDTRQIKEWMAVLKDDYDFCYTYSSFNPNPAARLVDFINREANSIVLFDREFSTKIEFIQVPLNYEHFFTVEKNGFILKIKNPYLINIKKQEFKRKKDRDDWIFFTQHLSA